MLYLPQEISETLHLPQQRDPPAAGWLTAAVCIAGPALVALIPMAAAPAMPAMARHFGATPDSRLFSQIVMTLPAAMLIVSAPLAGLLAGRVGQRAVLLGSLLLYLIGGAGVLAISSAEALIALRLLLGIGGGGVLTASLGLIGERFDGHHRERLLGYATAAASMLAAIALIFGGRLVDVGGWQAPFALYLLALPTLCIAAFAIRSRPAPPSLAASGGKLGELRQVWPYFALLILLTLAMFTPAVQVAFVLEARGMDSAQNIGAIIAATSVVAMLSAWSFGFLRRYIGLHGFLALNALAMGLGILTIGVAPSTTLIFLGCGLVGIGAGMSEPAIASIIFRRTSAASHALAMGVIVSALNAGQFINPLLFDPLRSWAGAGGAFILVGGFVMAVATAIAVAHPQDLLRKGDPQ